MYTILLFLLLLSLSGISCETTENIPMTDPYHTSGHLEDDATNVTALPAKMNQTEVSGTVLPSKLQQTEPLVTGLPSTIGQSEMNVTEVPPTMSLPKTNVTGLLSNMSDPILDDTMEKESFWEYELSLQVQAYAGIIIVLLGVTGNTIVIATLSHKGHLSSTNIYLVNLAAADLCVCIVGQLCRVLPRALTGIDTGNLDRWICKSWFFVNHSAKTISGWTLVAVTIERTLVVTFPLRARELCTTIKAKIAICVINVLCMAVYLHYFWSYGPAYELRGNQTIMTAGCTIASDFPEILPYMLHIRPWQDFIIRSAAPFLCLLICNIVIITTISKHMRARQAIAGEQKPGVQQDNRMTSMTIMLLTVSFAHLICIAPLQIMYLIDKSDPYGRAITERWQAQVALRWAFAIDVYYANHAINFILYCISGKTFRREVQMLFARMPCCTRLCTNKDEQRHFFSTDGNPTIVTISTRDLEKV